MTPVWWMMGAAVGSWLIVTMAANTLGGRPVNPELAFGMLGPLVSAVATWVVAARTQRVAPERVTAVLIAGFAFKVVLVGVYMAVMLRVVGLRPVAFAVGFTSYFIGLHVIEALFLKRLFADGTRSSSSV